MRDLAKAENAVADSIKAREALVAGLEQLLETNRKKLGEEEVQRGELRARKATIETRMREVEAAIMSGLAEGSNGTSTPTAAGISAKPYERPDVEALTPPPVESFTPTGSPTLQPAQIALPPDDAGAPASAPVVVPGADLLSSLAHARPAGDGGVYKKRKMSRSAVEDEFAAFEGDGGMGGMEETLGDLI